MKYKEVITLVEEKIGTKQSFLKEVEMYSPSILNYIYKLGYMLNLNSCDKSIKNHWLLELKSPLTQLIKHFDVAPNEIELNSAFIKNLNHNFEKIKNDIFNRYGKKGNPKIFKNINEIKYEDFYTVINKYIPKISKFYIDNLYNFKKCNAKDLISDFINSIF